MNYRKLCVLTIHFQLQDVPLDDDVCHRESINLDYVHRMKNSGEWGDGVMLAAAVHTFHRQVVVVLADKNDTVPLPFTSNETAESSPVYVGYVASMQHYVHLEPKVHQSFQQQQSKSSNVTGTTSKCL